MCKACPPHLSPLHPPDNQIVLILMYKSCSYISLEGLPSSLCLLSLMLIQFLTNSHLGHTAGFSSIPSSGLSPNFVVCTLYF